MKSFKILMALATMTTTMANMATAQEKEYTISKNVSIVSDYVFRGISQSDEAPALQGEVGFEHMNGFHASIWGSTINFANDGDESIELDLSAGYAFNYNGIDFDLGAIQYYYPETSSSRNYNFLEFYANAGKDFGPVAATVGVNYSNDYFASSGQTQYYSLGLEAPVYENLTAVASIGRHYIDDNASFGTPDYTDYAVGVDYDFKGYKIGLAYTDTSLNKTECADGCEGRAVLSISRDF